MKMFVPVLFFLLANIALGGGYEQETLKEIESRAEAGNALYQAKLAELYVRGTDEVAQSVEKALPLLRKSYEQGHPFAAYLLGYLALTGVPLEKSQDRYFAEALTGLEQMVAEGDPEAALKLSAHYRYGWGTVPDAAKAEQLLTKAAEAGVPRAVYILGNNYLTGQTTERNYEKAYRLLSEISATNREAEYQVANMMFAGLGTEPDRETALELIAEIQAPNEDATRIVVDGDYLIPDLSPPTYSLAIDEGSCGENVLWTILRGLKRPASQYEINFAGGNPGRGLHSDEMFSAMRELEIPHEDISASFPEPDGQALTARYHDALYGRIIPRVLQGDPVMIGVKIYPTQFPEWAYDHFILLVGYNRNTDELIFNDFNNRRRMPAAGLLEEDPGYSLVSRHNIVFAVAFPRHP